MTLIRVWLESVPGFADFASCVHFPAILSNDHLSQFSVKQVILMFSVSHNWVFGSSWPFSFMWLSFSLLLQSCFLPFNLLFAIFWKTVELYVMSVSEAQVILTCLTDYQRIWLLFSLGTLIMWINRLRRVKLKLEGLSKTYQLCVIVELQVS